MALGPRKHFGRTIPLIFSNFALKRVQPEFEALAGGHKIHFAIVQRPVTTVSVVHMHFHFRMHSRYWSLLLLGVCWIIS